MVVTAETESQSWMLLQIIQNQLLAPGSPVTAKVHGTSQFWAGILKAAGQEGVAPTVWKYCPGRVSAEVLQRFARTEAAITLRNRWLAGELSRVIQLVAAAGLRCLAFKGPVLAATAYGGVASRQFGDLDLLAAEAEYSQVLETLQQAGYRVGRQLLFETTLKYMTSPIEMDLHWGLARPQFGVRPAFNDLWTRRRIVQVEHRSITTLSAEDTLLALCVNAGKDFSTGRIRLRNLVDIAMLVRAEPNLDVLLLNHIARRMKARRMLAFGLLAASETLHFDQLRALVTILRLAPDSWIRQAVCQTRERFVHGRAIDRSRIVFLGAEHVPERLWFLGLWVDGAIRLWRILKTPTPRDTLPLPVLRGCSAIRYLVRPVRLAVSSLRSPSRAWRHLCGRTDDTPGLDRLNRQQQVARVKA